MLNRHMIASLVAATVVGAALALGVGLVAGAPDTAVPWSVFGSGGGTTLSSTSYNLGATAGQTAIGPAGSTGYKLGAGFWYGVCAVGSAGDSDCDATADSTETACGSNAGNPASIPERIDGAFAGVDDDGNDGADEALPAGAEAFDCDGDGFSGLREAGAPLCGNGVNDDNVIFGGSDDGVVDDGCPGGPAQVGTFSEAQFNIGLTDQDPCGNNGWPAELAGGDNKVTLQDVTSFTVPSATRKFGTSPGHPNYNSRWDLVPGSGSIWIALNDITSLTTGPTSRPPMLGGVRAFGGPVCPWPG